MKRNTSSAHDPDEPFTTVRASISSEEPVKVGSFLDVAVLLIKLRGSK